MWHKNQVCMQDENDFIPTQFVIWVLYKHIFYFTECIYVVSEEGEYSVESSVIDGNACGVYIYADTKQTIEVTFDSFNIPCESASLVTVSFVKCFEGLY